MVSPVADFVVAVGLDGRIVSQGSIDEALEKDPALRKEALEEEKIEEKGLEVVENLAKEIPRKDGKLILAEEKAEGHVGWPALILYLTSMGGPVFWAIFFIISIGNNLIQVVQNYWLGYFFFILLSYLRS